MARLIRFDGSEELVYPVDRPKGFSLSEMYALIGCQMIETVYLKSGQIMILDEEGKLRDDCEARENPKASLLLHGAGGAEDDFITGNVLICNDEEFQ
jgi:hypothetical protein